jgi:hypothetical protein
LWVLTPQHHTTQTPTHTPQQTPLKKHNKISNSICGYNGADDSEFPGHLFFAVSAGADPTGDWFEWSMPGLPQTGPLACTDPNNYGLSDYPQLTYNDDAILVTAVAFCGFSATATNPYSLLMLLPKREMYAGAETWEVVGWTSADVFDAVRATGNPAAVGLLPANLWQVQPAMPQAAADARARVVYAGAQLLAGDVNFDQDTRNRTFYVVIAIANTHARAAPWTGGCVVCFVPPPFSAHRTHARPLKAACLEKHRGVQHAPSIYDTPPPPPRTRPHHNNKPRAGAAGRVGLSATMFNRGVGADIIPERDLLYQPDDNQDLVPVLDAGGPRFTYGVRVESVVGGGGVTWICVCCVCVCVCACARVLVPLFTFTTRRQHTTPPLPQKTTPINVPQSALHNNQLWFANRADVQTEAGTRAAIWYATVNINWKTKYSNAPSNATAGRRRLQQHSTATLPVAAAKDPFSSFGVSVVGRGVLASGGADAAS